MPRILTKKRSEKYTANQGKLIKFRLMEISLEVDDYVYKNKPICDSTAKLYIQEVSSYKAMCSKDPRSLQVIEKLIRCMKGIITERKEDNCQDNIENDKETHNNTPSPVYSVTDEDKMHISQNVLGNNYTEESKRLEEVETIDLCNDDDDIDINNEYKIQDNFADIEVHIEKAISNLNILEVEEIQTKADNIDFAQHSLYYPEENMTANVTIAPKYINANKETTTDISGIYLDCSLSLLDNYNDNDLTKNKDITDQNVKALLTANLKKNIAEVMSNYKSITIHSNKNNNENNNMDNVKLATNTSGIHESQTKMPVTISNVITKTCIDKITPQSGIKTATNTSIITTNNKDSNKARVIDQIEKSVPKKKRTQKKKAETNISKDFKETVKTNKPSKRQAKVKIFETNQEKHISSNRNDFENSIPNIYTRNVEEDLSWMEDIRYVREHIKDQDENLMNMEESFWENYSLPAMWDDQDFLYTV